MSGKKIALIFVMAIIAAAIVFYIANPSSFSGADSTQTSSVSNDDLTVSLEAASAPAQTPDVLHEYVIGEDDAPITVVEYASYSCGHCGTFFRDVYPQVKEKLVDTGKLKFIFKDFPLNGPALMASKLTHCVDESRHKGMVAMLFETQENWMASQDRLKDFSQMARLAGLSEQAFGECLDNENLDTAILSVMQEAKDQYEISSTPSFVFFNSAGRIEKFTGVRSVEEFERVIEKLSE